MPALRRLLHYQIYPKRKCHNGSATISAFDVHKFWVFLNFETTFPPSLLLPMLWNVSSCDGCGLAESSCSQCAHCAILSEHGWEGKIGKAVLRWPCKQEGNSGAPCSGRGFPRQFQVSWEHLWNPTSQLCCCSFTHCASFSLTLTLRGLHGYWICMHLAPGLHSNCISQSGEQRGSASIRLWCFYLDLGVSVVVLMMLQARQWFVVGLSCALYSI